MELAQAREDLRFRIDLGAANELAPRHSLRVVVRNEVEQTQGNHLHSPGPPTYDGSSRALSSGCRWEHFLYRKPGAFRLPLAQDRLKQLAESDPEQHCILAATA